MRRCLDDHTVLALFDGRAPPSVRDAAQQHIDVCRRCREVVSAVARGDGVAPAGVPVLPSPGLVIGDRYRLQHVLGEGATGTVWCATDTMLRDPVALKVLRSSDPAAIRRFFREARVTEALRHPHIVHVRDIFVVESKGPAVLVMDLLTGAPLAAWVRGDATPPPLKLPSIVKMLRELASALMVAHGVGVVHRDLKPENIFLAGSRGVWHVKLLDFGLAKLTAASGGFAKTSSLTKTGMVVGTPHYMAPEQIRQGHDVDHRADLWALGVIAYEILAGVRPIDGRSVSDVWRALERSDIKPLATVAPRIPKTLSKMVDGLLSRSPERRPSLHAVETTLSSLS